MYETRYFEGGTRLRGEFFCGMLGSIGIGAAAFSASTVVCALLDDNSREAVGMLAAQLGLTTVDPATLDVAGRRR
jgi:hypothetical protein